MEKEIDLHGMTVEEARCEIYYELDKADIDVKKINVVHGYKKGTKIRDMIRKEIEHPRIKKIYVEMNPGITTIELK